MVNWKIFSAPQARCSIHRENEKQDSENAKKAKKSNKITHIKGFSVKILICAKIQ